MQGCYPCKIDHEIGWEIILLGYKFCFVLFEWTPSRRKEVCIPFGILPHGNKTNIPTSLGRVNTNTAAAGDRIRCLAQHQAATQTQADWNSVCPQRNTGVHNAHGWTPDIVRTLCRPFQAFRWFPIHKPSSNSTVPVPWITEPATDSQLVSSCFCTFLKHCFCKQFWNMVNWVSASVEIDTSRIFFLP